MAQVFDLVIVGAGPSGLALAVALRDTDLRIAIVDSHDEKTLCDAPFDGREIALTHFSKCFLEEMGIWQLIDVNEIFPLREAMAMNGNSDFKLHFKLPKTDSTKRPIDRLGFLVSNHHIRTASYMRALEQENITWFYKSKVERVASDECVGRVWLQDESVLEGSLIIAADSRMSSLRRQMGIACDMNDFGRTVLVFRLQHCLSNDHNAVEGFFYGNTLALLPLTDYITNCVITIDSAKLMGFKAKSAQELAEYVAKQINYRFGEMQLISEVFDYPLLGTHARRFYAQRMALVGDAACGMHPVTAHGYNLGLKGVDILSRLILRQVGQGLDIGDYVLLKEYSRKHRLNTLPLYLGTNAIVALFTNEKMPARFLRHAVLRMADNMPFLKGLITRQLTG